MPSTWPTQALKAQTIASRSYAARRLRPGVSYYDVTDDTSSQVYYGALGEKAASNALISATTGGVLRSPTGAITTPFPFGPVAARPEEQTRTLYVSKGDRCEWNRALVIAPVGAAQDDNPSVAPRRVRGRVLTEDAA